MALDHSDLQHLLASVAAGEVSPSEACQRIEGAGQAEGESFVDLGYAKPDLSRGRRTGASEVVYGAGKTAGQIVGIVEALVSGGAPRVLVTRVEEEKACETQRLLKDRGLAWDYHEDARLAVVGELPEPTGNGYVAVCCAGTSDLYCAEEAALTAQALGSDVIRVYDVGVAGIHRLLAHTDELQDASAIVAIAGMEGALASVVAGLVSCPVIACPTSVGYGASLGGVAALLGMLNSCASGVSVVNIDNGFGAGYQAAMIDHAGQHRN